MCPSGFDRFDEQCYRALPALAASIQEANNACLVAHINSSLVTFKSHEWSNVNSTRFLGRNYNDILLEYFHSQMQENNLADQNEQLSLRWLRLLLGDQHDSNDCVLRYFTRSSGTFTAMHRCQPTGHPVCRTDPLLVVPSEVETTITAVSRAVTSSTSDMISEEDPSIACVNCTMDLLPDEALAENQTQTQSNATRPMRSVLMNITAPLFALLLLILAVVLLLYYIHRYRGSYSPRQAMRIVTHHRRRNPTVSTVASSGESSASAVLYTRLQATTPSHSNDVVVLPVEERVRLLHRLPTSSVFHDELTKEDDEEPLYAIVKDTQDK
jgi:flagellar biogenesis protein FliO